MLARDWGLVWTGKHFLLGQGGIKNAKAISCPFPQNPDYIGKPPEIGIWGTLQFEIPTTLNVNTFSSINKIEKLELSGALVPKKKC